MNALFLHFTRANQAWRRGNEKTVCSGCDWCAVLYMRLCSLLGVLLYIICACYYRWAGMRKLTSGLCSTCYIL